jgi:hypothetical protein
MGLQPEDFSGIGEARDREEATQRFLTLKEKFKTGFKRMALILHPDRNGGDPEKTATFHLLMSVAKEFDNLRIKPPTTVKYQTTFSGPIPPPPPKRSGVPRYYPIGYPGTETQNRYSTNADRVAQIRPRGVNSPRGR